MKDADHGHGSKEWIAADAGVRGHHQFMLIHEAEARLLSMLADAGVSRGPIMTSDVRTIVDVFRRFSAIPTTDAAPVDEDGDGVLAQFGTYSFRGLEEFSTDFTRQFIEPANEDPRIWQLSCTIYWAATPETVALSWGNLWSFGMRLDDFFGQALALPGWAWAVSGAAEPRDLELAFEDAC